MTRRYNTALQTAHLLPQAMQTLGKKEESKFLLCFCVAAYYYGCHERSFDSGGFPLPAGHASNMERNQQVQLVDFVAAQTPSGKGGNTQAARQTGWVSFGFGYEIESIT